MSEVVTEIQMEDIIVLFYKIQKNLDDTFTVRAKAFIESYGGDDKADSIKTIHDMHGPKDNGTS